MARLGAALGRGFIDAGGRDVTISLQSRVESKHDSPQITIIASSDSLAVAQRSPFQCVRMHAPQWEHLDPRQKPRVRDTLRSYRIKASLLGVFSILIGSRIPYTTFGFLGPSSLSAFHSLYNKVDVLKEHSCSQLPPWRLWRSSLLHVVVRFFPSAKTLYRSQNGGLPLALPREDFARDSPASQLAIGDASSADAYLHGEGGPT
jgi:hypothetical protein